MITFSHRFEIGMALYSGRIGCNIVNFIGRLT